MKLKKIQHDFLKMGWGAKAVWNFSENSSVLLGPPVPYWQANHSNLYQGYSAKLRPNNVVCATNTKRCKSWLDIMVCTPYDQSKMISFSCIPLSTFGSSVWLVKDTPSKYDVFAFQKRLPVYWFSICQSVSQSASEKYKLFRFSVNTIIASYAIYASIASHVRNNSTYVSRLSS